MSQLGTQAADMRATIIRQKTRVCQSRSGF
jgi:hypothetical protein